MSSDSNSAKAPSPSDAEQSGQDALSRPTPDLAGQADAPQVAAAQSQPAVPPPEDATPATSQATAHQQQGLNPPPEGDTPGQETDPESSAQAEQAGGKQRVSAAAETETPPSEPGESQAELQPQEVEPQEVEPEEEPEEEVEDVEPLELIEEEPVEEEISTDWYILKVQVNREDSIRDALQRRVKVAGLEAYFGEIVVPTEDVAEFSKSGKRRIVKKKLYPGYIMVNMAINDDTWFLVRETPGIGDFTGSAGKPTPMDPKEVERILRTSVESKDEEAPVRTAIPFKAADRVRVKEGYFQNFEGDVESVDEANGRVTVMINIFGRSTPVELEHWQIEAV